MSGKAKNLIHGRTPQKVKLGIILKRIDRLFRIVKLEITIAKRVGYRKIRSGLEWGFAA
jgi:hypothetical protein